MTDQKKPNADSTTVEETSTCPARRRLLKALGGAGGTIAAGKVLPEKWTRPVVESVLLPAHAQATGQNPVLNFAGSVTPGASAGPGPSTANKVLDFLIPPAHATFAPEVTGTLCVSVTGSSFSATLLLMTVSDCGIYTGNGTVGGAFASLTGVSMIFSEVMLQVPNVSSSSLNYDLSFKVTLGDFGYTASGSINPGACSISGGECVL